MWNSPAGSASRRRPACGGGARWGGRASPQGTTPCLRRVRALEEAGYIKGYRALLDEKLLGYEVTVFAMVHLSSQAEADLAEFERFVRAQPLVRECWMLSGEIDFILKCVAPDLKTFQAFVTELTAAPHVRNVKTSLTLRNSKDAAMVPMEMMRVSP